MPDDLDRDLEKRGHKVARYADPYAGGVGWWEPRGSPSIPISLEAYRQWDSGPFRLLRGGQDQDDRIVVKLCKES